MEEKSKKAKTEMDTIKKNPVKLTSIAALTYTWRLNTRLNVTIDR